MFKIRFSPVGTIGSILPLSCFAAFALQTFTVAVFAQEENATPTPPETPIASSPDTIVAPAPEASAPPVSPAAYTQEELENLFVKTEKEAAALGPNNAKFHELFVKWRELLKELRALKLEYQTAKPSRQVEIENIYTEKLNVGMQLQPELAKASLAAFEETPFRNPYVLNHLCGLIEWESNRENYEKSVELYKTIESKGMPEGSEVITIAAALAAFKSMDFQTAERLLNVIQNFESPEGQTKSPLELYLENYDNEDRSNASLLSAYPLIKKNWEEEKKIRDAEAAETDPEKMLPRVLIKTTKGDIVLELFENEAPNTVANFISLVEKGFYDKTPFHRVLHYFMAQGGDPTGTGRGGPGYVFDDECRKPDTRKHFRGSISMANAGENTNGSQFFLTFVPTFFLDGRHTVFGRVVEGMEVLADIRRVNPETDSSGEVDRIVEAKVLRKRSHEYTPVTKPDPRGM